MVPGRRTIFANTSSALAICGTLLGLTKLAASTRGRPAAASLSHSSALTSGESLLSSFCKPSRGPTSTISMRTQITPRSRKPSRSSWLSLTILP